MLRWYRALLALDARLVAVPTSIQYLAVAITGLVIVWCSLSHVPREFIDYSTIPWLRAIHQPASYGPDTIADMYAAKVVLNDPRDMYTKRRLEQTPRQARTWSKPASAPYPPAMLLTQALLYAIGDASGVGLYGMTLVIVSLFLSLSAWYFLQTRWYLFPLLYLNFSYLGYRFVEVQDGSYAIMLLVLLLALLLARKEIASSHLLVALAITMKALPAFYVTQVPRMPRRTRVLFMAILACGLILPIFVFENYLYIYRFHNEVKGRWPAAAGALVLAPAFALLLARCERRLRFDWEDRIGWSLLPLALLLGIKMNVARHVIIALLVPDKRALRNVAVSVGLAAHALFPGVIALGAVLPIAAGVLVVGLLARAAAEGAEGEVTRSPACAGARDGPAR